MTLSERIQSALDAYYRDDADIDIMANLLVDSLGVISQADTNFHDISTLCAEIDKGLEKLNRNVRVQG